VPSGCASRLKHPLDAGVHFALFDEFAPRNLVNPDLYLRHEARGVGKHVGYSFLDQVIRSAPGSEGELVQLGFLIFGQKDFHCF